MDPSERRAVMSWDWKDQPDLDELDRLIYDLSGCTLRAYQVDTGSDEYAIVLSTADLTEQAVSDAYREWLDNG